MIQDPTAPVTRAGQWIFEERARNPYMRIMSRQKLGEKTEVGSSAERNFADVLKDREQRQAT